MGNNTPVSPLIDVTPVIPAPPVTTTETNQSTTFVPSTSTQVNPQQPKKHTKLKIFLSIIGILFLFGIISIGYLILQGIKEGPQVKTKVTSFLQSVSNNDLNGAYSLTSSGFKEVTSIDDFTKAMNLFKAQYSDFKSQEQTGFSVEANAGQPTLYKYSGKITYGNNDKGDLSATLVKENNEWKIYYINVNVSINRASQFQQQGQKSVLGVSTSK